MNSVDRVKELCKEKKIPISKLERDLGFSNGYIGQLRKGVFPADRLQEIAYYFKIPLEYLLGKEGVQQCPICGLEYDASNLEDCYEHEKEHSAFINAENKFGNIYPSNELEKIKNANWKIIADSDKSLSEKMDAWVEIFKTYWSRSLAGCGYNLSHPDFNKYVAMLLNQPSFVKRINNEIIYKKLVAIYGTASGIKNGETYYRQFDLLDRNANLVQTFEQLQEDNQKRVISYTNKLLELQQMENNIPFPEAQLNAAQQRTDVEIPDDIDTSDNDIMDDENF